MEENILSDDSGKIMVTSQFYYVLAFISLILIIAAVKYSFANSDGNHLLFGLILLPIIPLIFHLRFIDIYIIDSSKIELVQFENNIVFTHIEEIKKTSLSFGKGIGSNISIYKIVYYKSDNRKCTRFLFVSQSKSYLIEKIKGLIH